MTKTTTRPADEIGGDRCRLIVGVDVDDPGQDSAVTRFLTERRLRWWHWTRGMWLVVADDPAVTAATLASALNDSPKLPRNGVFVLDADDPRAFAGFVAAPEPADRAAALRFLREAWAGKVSDRSRTTAPPAVAP